ncbi:Transcription factor MYB44 [Platanthera guangdongensis]|uniref:Transcription factor MYB44 n=1 Tax=Platanthera guangdongensis TaxID=2320717 RepID=A0ABR2MRG5_9ASPA
MSSDYPAALAPQAKKDRHIVSWTREEDDLLRDQVAVNGSDNWTIIAARFKDKSGRQCRRRWLTHLSSDCKKGGWSQEEDMLLCEAQKIFGNRWTEIAKVVSGRTDNAVKNRFSTLCKKRSKQHTVSKENNDSHGGHPRNKKIMVEPSVNKEQIRRDDPKITSLLQQAELLSSFAVKAYSENKNHGFEDAWKELQNYLMIRTREGGNMRNISGMDFLLNNFGGLFKDLKCVDAEIQLSRRETDAVDLWISSEMTTGCTRDKQGSHAHKNQPDHCAIGCNEGPGHEQEESPAAVKFVFKGEVMSSSSSCSLEVPQNVESQLDLSKSEFESPVKTIPPFHSFTEEIPSPEFSSSEKKFLQIVLGASSPKAIPSRNKVPCKRDPQTDSKQSPLCKRVLLNSL